MNEVNDKRDYGAFIPAILDDYPLDVWEFRIYARAARRAGNRGLYFESAPNLARAFGCSERQARYALRLLAAAGMLTERRRNGRSTVYTLTPASQWVPGSEVRGLRETIRTGNPERRPAHKKKTPAHDAGVEDEQAPAPDAGNPCTMCSPTPAPGAAKGSPIEGSPIKEPVAEGDGKKPASRRLSGLTFEKEFGFCWSPSHQRLIDESRAAAILRQEGIIDAGQARRIVGEWTATMLRRPDGDPAAALIWCCRNQLANTTSGDERMPAWS